jgi:hypothetical protein
MQAATVLKLSCTVCNNTTNSSYAWKRHEGSHYGPWICMPNGSHLIGDFCGICGSQDSSAHHKTSHHKINKCGRSFRGRDKLIDHLKIHLGLAAGAQLHKTQIMKRYKLLKAWESPAELAKTALWCGFCQWYLESWTARQNHVLKHMQDGRARAEWTPELQIL